MTILWSDAVQNAQADEDAARAVTAHLHTADSGLTGANEATGGTPAYAPITLAWEAAGVEGPLGASQPATVGIAWCEATFDLPAGTFTHYSYEDGVGPVGGDALPEPIVFASQGTKQISFSVGPNA